MKYLAGQAKLLAVLAFLSLTACSGRATATATPTPDRTPTSTHTPAAASTATATAAAQTATPSANATPTPVPTPAGCDAGYVVFSVLGVAERTLPQGGLYLACADGSFLAQILRVTELGLDLDAFAFNPAASPDGRQLAFIVYSVVPGELRHTRIFLLDLFDYSTREIYSANYDIFEMDWSADGEYLGYITVSDYATYHTEILHLDSLAISQIVDADSLPVDTYDYFSLANFDWSPDGTQILYRADVTTDNVTRYSWHILDVQCDPQTHLCQTTYNRELGWPDENSPQYLAWFPDGSGMTSVYEDQDGAHLALRRLDGSLIQQIEVGEVLALAEFGNIRATLSPDMQRIAIIADTDELSLGDVFILTLQDMSIVRLTEPAMFEDVLISDVKWLP